MQQNASQFPSESCNEAAAHAHAHRHTHASASLPLTCSARLQAQLIRLTANGVKWIVQNLTAPSNTGWPSMLVLKLLLIPHGVDEARFALIATFRLRFRFAVDSRSAPSTISNRSCEAHTRCQMGESVVRKLERLTLWSSLLE
jgi:hypothetical protein